MGGLIGFENVAAVTFFSRNDPRLTRGERLVHLVIFFSHFLCGECVVTWSSDLRYSDAVDRTLLAVAGLVAGRWASLVGEFVLFLSNISVDASLGVNGGDSAQFANF